MGTGARGKREKVRFGDKIKKQIVNRNTHRGRSTYVGLGLFLRKALDLFVHLGSDMVFESLTKLGPRQGLGAGQ